MARGLNKVILIGNLGRDPEVRYTPNGLGVANLTLATTDSWADKKTGETQEHTEWHRIVMYQHLAEISGKYLRKGSKVYVEGRLKTRKWVDKTTNQERYVTEVIVDRMLMLDSKSSALSDNMETESAAAAVPQTPSSMITGVDQQLEDEDIPF